MTKGRPLVWSIYILLLVPWAKPRADEALKCSDLKDFWRDLLLALLVENTDFCIRLVSRVKFMPVFVAAFVFVLLVWRFFDLFDFLDRLR